MDRLMRLFAYINFSIPYILLSNVAAVPAAFIGIMLFGAADTIMNALVAYFLLSIAAAVGLAIACAIYKRSIGRKKAAELHMMVWRLHEKHSVHVDPSLELVEGERILFGPTPCLVPELRKRVYSVMVTNKRITLGIQPRFLLPGFRARKIFFMPIIFGEVNAWHGDLAEFPKTKSRLGFPLHYNLYPKNSRVREISCGSDEVGNYMRVNWVLGGVVTIYHPHSKEICRAFSSKMS